MAFSVTYHQLSTNNIRNLYGGLPTEIKWRTTGNPKALSPPDRFHERQKRPAPEEKFIMNRYYEFDDENKIHIPRAPAFRLLSRARVNDIVSRLSQPTINSSRRTSSICEREVKRSLSETCRKCKSASTRRNYSPRALDELTERVSSPTVTASVRNSMRCLKDMSVPEVKYSCGRFAAPPSERFVREFSMIV